MFKWNYLHTVLTGINPTYKMSREKAETGLSKRVAENQFGDRGR